MRDKESLKPQIDGLDSFIASVEEEFKRTNPKVPLEEVREDLAARCMDRWLVLDRREKMFFSRKNLPFKNHRLPAKKRRRSRDPDQPKRALTAYLYFCKEERRLLSKSGSTLPLGDITREIAKRWKQVTPEQRQHFERLAAVDKQRYQEEMKAFRHRRFSNVDEDTLSLIRQAKNDNDDFGGSFMIDL